MGHSTDEELETKEMDVRSLSSSHRHAQSAPYMHKVGVPPKQNLFKEFTSTVKETFFADDPLRPFKDQPRSRKFVLGLQAIFPILEWGRDYSFSKFRGDLISGLTIASLCIPQVYLLLLSFIQGKPCLCTTTFATVTISLTRQTGYWICKTCKFGTTIWVM